MRIHKSEDEGGCGVVGFASTIPVRGKHIFEPSVQMHNRGNGKGGGIAAVGLSHEDLGVTKSILEEDYLLQIALLDPEARKEIEAEFITPLMDVDKSERIPTVSDYRTIEGLETKPPGVWRYFVRVKAKVLDRFISETKLEDVDRRRAEDEFIYQNSFKINTKFYASLGDKRAFVLSHGRNMMILKIVGYAENTVKYYKLDDFRAHVWIAHQRYPTRGRVWHPGGAHPFVGMHEALVHNGDFANYHAIAEYLEQRGRHPLFLTDTEVSVLLFDLLNRKYNYPLEYIIEAVAPTTEFDFDMLPPKKQEIYHAIQTEHIHGSPDGPWFFIIARNEPYGHYFQLIGITDTAMLRPQVFALIEGEEVQIGLIGSEKQAIDATLKSLSDEDKRFPSVADKYWNARGGSYTDGGAFMFSIDRDDKLVCTNKFGEVVKTPEGQTHCDFTKPVTPPLDSDRQRERIAAELKSPRTLFVFLRKGVKEWDCNKLRWTMSELTNYVTKDDGTKTIVIAGLTLLNDRRYDTGTKKRSSVVQIAKEALHQIFDDSPAIEAKHTGIYHKIGWSNKDGLRPPGSADAILILNAAEFPPEGEACDARLIVKAYGLGWKRFIVYNAQGQRFCGSGLGNHTIGIRIDVYDSSGDYLGSSMDGAELYIHGNGQDQLGQILKSGKLVVFGDVGQTFMYGAKGGDAYVLGNAAGRPLINAVGKPRVVINGTCLDYLAESFMAGDPLNGGGFVVVNGLDSDGNGNFIEQDTPYPGSNLFSLASGGAIYIRDPHHKLVEEQLNGGEFSILTAEDWAIILPYLEENERLFGISIEEELLVVNGNKKSPQEVYRKVRPMKAPVLVECEEGED
ncbi:Glutamate synthase domain-containing protein 1/Glutamate synthase domain-containing protein 3 [Methanophagales archaeon]|nr:Glutamate synthase domain-containing protein 1/Glutamate synthase domain-containing protein 3 [Methanophagales archaeon]